MKSKKRARKPRAPKSRTVNRTQLAHEYGISLQTVDSWVRRGCPHERRDDGGYVFRIPEVAKWRARALAEDSTRRGYPGRRPIPEAASEWLHSMIIGHEQMLPWIVDKVEPGPDTAHVVRVDEYREHYGIDGDELLLRLAYGLPTMPPPPGKKFGARISIPHANVWLMLFSGMIESLGGDGTARDIAHEAQRLRGFPVKRDVGDFRRNANSAEHVDSL